MGITKSSGSGQRERTGLLSRLFKPKASECCDGVILEADEDVAASGSQSDDCCGFTIVEEDEDDAR